MSLDMDRQDMLEAALLVVDNVDAMLAYWDHDLICHFANQAYREWFGKSREEILGIHVSKLLGPDLYRKNLPMINEALKGNPQVFEREVILPTGAKRHSLITYKPHIVEGDVKGLFVHVANSNLFKALEKQLQDEKNRAMELAAHDYLTGLPNRLHLVNRIENAIEDAERNNKLFSIMSMDLDNLKTINDRFGHDVGDMLLKEIAERLKGILRESDTVSRIGGDEFILISTEIKSVNDVETIASRILDTVSRPFEYNKINIIKPTFSIGIAIYPTYGESADELIKNSDNALYEAKRLGKNRFEFA